MKCGKLLGIVALTAVVWPVLARAQSTPHIDQQQANQERRIDQGIATGQLTEQEAARLEKGQAHVQQMEDRALSDGTMTKRERGRIERAQGRQSRRIARQKHDRQRN